MKKMFVIALIVWSVMLLLPLSVIGKDTVEVKEKVVSVASTEISQEKEIFMILEKDSGKITEMSAQDYIFGVVAAEMPAIYEEEALKAQAVAAYTFAIKRSEENKGEDYDITTDYTVDQSFITIEKARENWGENADKYEEKIKKAVEETKNQVITYNDEPILSVYHAISSGRTSDCKDVWNTELAYLKPVLSEWDKLSESYIVESAFTVDEIKDKFKDIEFSGAEKDFFSKTVLTESKLVKEINLCSKIFSGEEIRKTLNLRSANFDVKYSDNKFIFTVYGYGHGVGMSQFGACSMAKSGSDYKEILEYYYTDCKVKKLD